ncbi:hypothetical protein HMPREF1210_00151 [Paenisporosarcina sp. HGH0030]|uniref:hypothetical protein n=1 Tax=Paenisporosarcina sp. HGH0030 TaxID=1078085 RepID=UPI00034EA86A|nr:hypothetical protein [Paenisporosarcina sp. HGH0030]EPD54166.1 hypothetical protein HMPREF1210_00151 [Paenisporosarcina sp. HGH0030]
MFELIKEILTKVGIPGLIVTIIVYVLKNNPITLISSSTIEMRLSTKEKRIYVSGIKVISEILLYVIVLLLLTVTFFSDDDIYHPEIAIISAIIIVGIFFWILILDLQGKNVIDLVKNFQRKWQIFFYILFLLHFMSFFLLSSYYVGTQIYSASFNVSLTNNEKLGVLIAVAFIYFLIIIFTYFTIIKATSRFLGLRNQSVKILSIKIDDATWYLFHPIDKNTYLLGNDSIINQCTKFSFIEKNELYKKTVEIDNSINSNKNKNG